MRTNSRPIALLYGVFALSLAVVAQNVVPEPNRVFTPGEVVDGIGSDWRANYSLSLGKVPMIFCQKGVDLDYCRLAVLTLIDGEWREMELPDPGQWQRIYQSDDYTRVWAISEQTVEGPGSQLVFYITDDGGLHWRQRIFKKPHYIMGLRTLEMGPNGSGKLSLRSDDDSKGTVWGVPRGTYTFATSNWGDTWSSAGYEANIANEAERASLSFPYTSNATETVKMMDEIRHQHLDRATKEQKRQQSK